MIVQEFDRPISAREPFERQLRYVFVDEVLPVLVDVLQDSGTGTSVLPDGDTVRTRIAPQASTQASTLTGRTRRGIQRREDDASQVGGRRDILISPVENNAPISVLVGKTRLIADVQANAILAMGPSADIAKINKILDRLDRRPPQVYLSTIIGQLELGDEIEFGIDYLSRLRETGSGAYAGALVTNQSEGVLGELIPRPPVPTPLPGAAPGLALPPGLDPVSGLLFYGNYKDDIEILVRALETTGRFDVLSRPAVFATNGKKAVIASGQQIPVPTSTLSRVVDSVSDSVTSEIEFKDVVLKLEVIPLINSNREVSLTIAQINDNEVDRQLIDGNLIPVIGTQQLTTSVTIPNQSTIILGGLISETERDRTSGLPVVSRIPYLGNLFKSTKKERKRTELLVFIQPTVVEGNDEIRGASLNEDLRTDIGADAFEAFPPPRNPVAPVPPPAPRPQGR
jgi:type II secretory pathway component GspD/PulD (secretin)